VNGEPERPPNGAAEDRGRPLLSATVICKDEVDKIRGCLESVRFCDEVVVVDSGSTDGTLAIARELADRVIETPWPGYVAQQNFATSQARGEWVLSVDADERVTPELADAIREALAGPPRADGFRISRHVHYLGRWIDHSGWYPEPRVRLFRRDRGRWEGRDPHYDIVVPGWLGRLHGEIQHFTYDDMADHIHTMNRFSSILARGFKERGRSFHWYQVLLRPPLEFCKMYVLRRGFLDGPQGFFVAAISAFSIFLKFAKLWEAERVGGDKPWVDRG
jgi:glycosyltransferase involved in cell wall biosynthesis